ncbi:hypothetical protein [Faecalibacterium prausnitzii]
MFFTFTSSAVESSGLSVCRFMNPLCDAALCRSAPIHHTLQFYAKCEQRSFCSAQNPTSFGVKLAYGVVFAGNPSKEKARNFSVHQEVSGFVLLKLGIYCSIGFIVGTGQGTRMKSFIFRYKPTHAASFLSRPYVTLRNSPQVTEDLV